MTKSKSDKVKEKISWELYPRNYQKAYEAGDPSAVDLCVLYCDQINKQLPEWARNALLERVDKTLNESVYKILNSKAPESIAIAAIMAVEFIGFEGEARFEVAEKLLEGELTLRCKPFTWDNIKSISHRMGQEFLVNDTAFSYYFARLMRAQYQVSKKYKDSLLDPKKINTALS